ncbi:hypothetical protein DPMN_050683 [Dreissena polymorpha]|uniref:Uncharacterized protein n=1 Tax=Dreissena polymorpha TaxID=45954 RepID=A0A9D4HN86_DREPO|nr:hypothetical protein DPMN_050683 [Dreissena polymorpha]
MLRIFPGTGCPGDLCTRSNRMLLAVSLASFRASCRCCLSLRSVTAGDSFPPLLSSGTEVKIRLLRIDCDLRYVTSSPRDAFAFSRSSILLANKAAPTSAPSTLSSILDTRSSNFLA